MKPNNLFQELSRLHNLHLLLYVLEHLAYFNITNSIIIAGKEGTKCRIRAPLMQLMATGKDDESEYMSSSVHLNLFKTRSVQRDAVKVILVFMYL